MRIGLVCPYNIFKNGGVQECVLALKNEYQKKGHEAYIITPRPKGVETENIDGILLVGQSRDFNAPFQATTAQISVTFDNNAIDSLLHEYRFDVLHFHEPWVPIVGRQILTRSNTVNVATFHAKLPDTMMSKTIEKVITPYTKSILKYIDAFTAVSDAAAEYVKSLTKKELTIVPNGIDIEKFQHNISEPREKHTILYIGRLEKRKGVLYLLKAFRQLQTIHPEAKLVIAGDGPDRNKLENYVELNDIDNVEFLGFIDEAKKIQLLAITTIYCSPAIYGESFGIVLLEAMAAGAVTVAGNNPGYTGVMKDTGAISITNVKDIDEFARKLQLLMMDYELRKLWTSWSSEYVTQFNYERIAELYLKVYKQAKKAHLK